MSFSATATATPGNMSGVLAKIKQAVQISVDLACEIVVEEAKALVPVRTGELRDSIGFQTEEADGKIIGTVSATSPHAGYVEYGTGQRGAASPGRGPYPYSATWKGMPAQPFMRPAVDMARDAVKEVFVDNVRLALR